MSDGVDALIWQAKAVGLPGPEAEFRFHPVRRWRFDLAWPAQMVAVEVDGGSWVGGRHTSGVGFEGDCVKLSTAAAMGWRVLRVTPKMIDLGPAITLLQAALDWPDLTPEDRRILGTTKSEGAKE